MYDLINEGHAVICEAVNIKTNLRRDVVDLTDDIIYEVETDPKRAARFSEDPHVDKIEVIELWN